MGLSHCEACAASKICNSHGHCSASLPDLYSAFFLAQISVLTCIYKGDMLLLWL